MSPGNDLYLAVQRLGSTIDQFEKGMIQTSMEPSFPIEKLDDLSSKTNQTITQASKEHTNG